MPLREKLGPVYLFQVFALADQRRTFHEEREVFGETAFRLRHPVELAEGTPGRSVSSEGGARVDPSRSAKCAAVSNRRFHAASRRIEVSRLFYLHAVNRREGAREVWQEGRE